MTEPPPVQPHGRAADGLAIGDGDAVIALSSGFDDTAPFEAAALNPLAPLALSGLDATMCA